MFFSQPWTLFLPLVLFCVYTVPVILSLARIALSGRFLEFMKVGGWGFLMWGGGATFFAVYFVLVHFLARKKKKSL